MENFNTMEGNSMTRQQQAAAKIQQLLVENQQLNNAIQELNTEYDILTDQYMDGRITWNIGGAQRRLNRQIDKLRKHVNKNSSTIWELKVKYNL